MPKEAEPVENKGILQLQAEILRLTEEIFEAYKNHQDISKLLETQQECAKELLAEFYPPRFRPTKVPYLKIIK